MRVRVGCEFTLKADAPTAAVFQVEPHAGGAHALVSEGWATTPELSWMTYIDLYGNRCRRTLLDVGSTVLRFDARADVTGRPDEEALDAGEVPAANLPDETLIYTLPSRFCLSDQLADVAWDHFGAVPAGWRRVQAISDFVHDHVEFGYGSSTPLTTAVEVYEAKAGVCRDFAHLGVTFCRALSIPARYVFGYLPDIGVPPSVDPMDFCAWMEVFLGGRWYTFDPRNNTRRVGRVLIGRGRDALDVAMVTTFGNPALRSMVVWAEEAKEGTG